MLIKNIVIIGSGNLATNLALALYEAGKNIVCIYSRTIKNAKTLADLCNAKYTNSIAELPQTADLYIIAVNDSSIKEIAENLSVGKGIVVHTSGSIPKSVFPKQINNFGVFYPLMTFSKNKKVSFSNIPICLEANSMGVFIALNVLANSISKKVVEISSEKRKLLHLAAVFACNFTNLNYCIAEDLLNRNQLSFDLLRPLLLETAQKTEQSPPSKNQTGPAFREDIDIMQEQMETLNQTPEYKAMYDLLSKLIISIKHKND
jgi:predicted short-subunit dehydrogenase-like oxidoreductase (DUF2520 family)